MNRSTSNYKIFRHEEALGLFMIDKFNTDKINVDTNKIGSSKNSNNWIKVVTNPITNVNFPTQIRSFIGGLNSVTIWKQSRIQNSEHASTLLYFQYSYNFAYFLIFPAFELMTTSLSRWRLCEIRALVIIIVVVVVVVIFIFFPPFIFVLKKSEHFVRRMMLIA